MEENDDDDDELCASNTAKTSSQRGAAIAQSAQWLRYCLDRPRLDFRKGYTFSFFRYDETRGVAHPTNTVREMDTSLGVKRTGREAANWTLCAEVKNAWSSTSADCHTPFHRDSFNITCIRNPVLGPDIRKKFSDKDYRAQHLKKICPLIYRSTAIPIDLSHQTAVRSAILCVSKCVLQTKKLV